jgi:GntR family transcriptional repressor for pyruvate dehydrogenase complex
MTSPAVSRPVLRPRLSDGVVSDLVREIISGRLGTGDTLPAEPELVGSYGISKVVVRESILSLQALGLVVVQQGKRTLVTNEREWDVLSPVVQDAFRAEGRGRELNTQLHEARMIVEPAAAGLSAARATPERIAELMTLADRLDEIASSSRDLREFLRTDRMFHDVIAQAGDNVAIRAMMRDLHRYMSSNWEESRIRKSELPLLARQHRVIAQAVAARDPDAARAAMVEHISLASKIETERAN